MHFSFFPLILHGFFSLSLFGLVAVSFVDAFIIEPQLNNLQFYGPTSNNNNWHPVQATLIDDGTYAVNVSLVANSQFLFVNKLTDGSFDWKAAKIGRSSLSPSSSSSEELAPIEIGGGNIDVQSKGDYTLTLYTGTASSNQWMLSMYCAGPWPSTTIIADSSIVFTPSFNIYIRFSIPVSSLLVNASKIQVTGASAPLSGLSMINSTTYIWNLTVTSRLINIVIPDSIAFTDATYNNTNNNNNTNNMNVVIKGNTGASYSVIAEDLSVMTTSSWGPTLFLKDNSTMWPDGKPKSGWWVTPIHGVVIPSSGEVIVTGWGRSDEYACQGTGARRQGVSFVLSPDAISSNAALSVNPHAYIAVDPNTHLNVTILQIQAISEEPRARVDDYASMDVLYCSGQTMTGDGRAFYTGGAWYRNLSSGAEKEYGLNYVRMFNFSSKTFQRYDHPISPIGTQWYPTATLLPSSLILIAGGFSAYTCSPLCTNPALALFNVTAADDKENGVSPYTMLLHANESTHDIDPAVKDYTHTYVLPQPIFVNDIEYQIIMHGPASGVVVLFSYSSGLAASLRFHWPVHRFRPSASSSPCSADSTSAFLSTDELMIMGGCSSSMLDLYNPYTDSWRSFDSGIVRNTPGSVLLPDGSVLLINGENPSIDQTSSVNTWAASDPRYPQLFYPSSGSFISLPTRETVTNFTGHTYDGTPATTSTGSEVSSDVYVDARSAPFRGYHSIAVLLKDASVLIGGGVHSRGDIGCEQPSLRVFYPPYLFGPDTSSSLSTPRPQLLVNGLVTIVARPCANFTVNYKQGPIEQLAMIATTAFTHAFNQHQRYVNVTILSNNVNSSDSSSVSGTLHIQLPCLPRLLPTDYFLFALTNASSSSSSSSSSSLSLSPLLVPSLGQHVRITLNQPQILPDDNNNNNNNNNNGSNDGSGSSLSLTGAAFVTIMIVSSLLVVLLLFCLCSPRVRSRFLSCLTRRGDGVTNDFSNLDDADRDRESVSELQPQSQSQSQSRSQSQLEPDVTQSLLRAK